MYEIFIKNNYYSIDELKEKDLFEITAVYSNFIEFKKDEYYYLFEKQAERLKNAYKYRFVALDKKNFV